jgi:hypothetical protein
MPLIFLPPSKPGVKQVGADLQDLSPDSCPLADSERGLSMMTARGVGGIAASPPPGQDQAVE